MSNPLDLRFLDVRAASEKGVVHTIKNPYTDEPITHDGKPYTVTVLGRDSAVVEERLADFDRRIAAGEKVSLKDRGVELWVAITKDWHIYLDGEWLDCTEENKRRVFSDPGMVFIGEQISPLSTDRQKYSPVLPTD